jgi:spore germination cell wall hydrolase CwlJ-like protein
MIATLVLATFGVLSIIEGWRPATGSQATAQGQPVDFSEAALQRKLAGFDPAMAALARRFDPLGVGHAAAAGLRFNPEATPDQFVVDETAPVSPAQAYALNASVPVSDLPNPAARPFVLDVRSDAGARALDCLTAAIYYEAAYESHSGQAAVAQVVLNRVRHPAYPKSICGVVLQGADRRTGCQFTFTCDGALGRSPAAEVWARCRAVATAALNGRVEKSVGNATHYHTLWVHPYWSSSLLKVRVIGAHVFYRWTGGWGLAGSFRGRYSGEADEYRGLPALYAALQPLTLRAAPPGEVPVSGVVLVSTGPDGPIGASTDASGVGTGASTRVAMVEAPLAPAPAPPDKFVHVSGEVVMSGDYVWREGMTVQDVVTAAGGFTYRAKTKEPAIRRAGETAEIKYLKGQAPPPLQPDDHVRILERRF